MLFVHPSVEGLQHSVRAGSQDAGLLLERWYLQRHLRSPNQSIAGHLLC